MQHGHLYATKLHVVVNQLRWAAIAAGSHMQRSTFIRLGHVGCFIYMYAYILPQYSGWIEYPTKNYVRKLAKSQCYSNYEGDK